MSQLPPDNSDSQQPADDSSQNQQVDNVVQGNQNRVVQGNNNRVIQGDKNVFNKTLNFFFKFTRQSSNESQNLRNPIQQKLLKIVNTEVKSRIKSSLHNHVYIVLDKEQNPSQVESPWEMEVKVGSQPKIRLQNTEITTVFDREEIAGRLLILGEPGVGKTTMLLKLAEELIKRANDNPTHPVPVLFTLSAWQKDNQSIKDWLVEQLKDKYGVRKDIGKKWVDNQEIIPLLDGLDEIAAERQELCVRKINDFLHPGTWSNPLLVCSRTEEYELYATLLQLNNSLELFPFTSQQVYQYLEKTDNLQLWNSIKNDADLNQLAQTPLLLNIIVLSLSAQEISIENWQQFKTSEKRRSYLFDAYICRMLERPYKGKQPQQEKTKRWLIWLGQRLVQENTTEFLIENMQPYWLKSKSQRLIYCIVAYGFLVSLSNVFIFGMTFGVTNGLIFAVINGLIAGLFIGFFSGTRGDEFLKIEALKFRLNFLNWQIYSLTNGLRFGLNFWLIFALVFGLIFRLKFVLILCFSTVFTFVLRFGLIGAIVGVEFEEKKFPNQGIYQSFINALYFAFFGSISITLLFFLIGLIILHFLDFNGFLDFNKAFHFSLFLGLLFGFPLGIFRGGTPVIKHLVLHVILWSNGNIPWNYAKFLNYSTNRLFIQQVGGRYRFIHKMLQDHFAQMKL